MKRRQRISSILLVLLNVPLFSQTQIVRQDVMDMSGASGAYEISNTGNVAVDLLTEGDGKVWDFTGLDMGTAPNIDEYSLQDISGTEETALFPGSNFVLRESHVDGTTWFVHTYVDLREDRLKIIARKMKDVSGLSVRWACPEDYYTLPLAMGTAWNSVQIDTFDFGFGPFISTTFSRNFVDASGTVRLPVGDFECLRLRTVSVEESGGNPFRTIKYTFLAKNNLLVAILQGQPDDTTHNFSSAVYVQRFQSIQTHVSGRTTKTPDRFFLARNYPNPFNPETRIDIELPDYSRVDLSVYNLKGERIRTLHSGYLVPGRHSFIWDGTNRENEQVPSGIYLYGLRCRGQNLFRRMTLIR